MVSMGIPMIVSMVLQAVYNIVDSAFVSNMANGGEAALNALTLAFPLQILMVAVGIGTGVGANVLVAKSLGAGDSEQADKAAGNAAFLGVVIYVVFLLFGLFGAEYYIGTQTKNAQIAEMGTDYLRICCVFSFGMSMFAVYEKLLQAAGHSVCSTIAQILGAVTNIILDPIMIYGWLGCPEMGVKGAAYATVAGQIVSFAAAVVFHIKKNKAISNRLCCFKPDIKIIGRIYSVGLPAIISQALISVMTYGLRQHRTKTIFWILHTSCLLLFRHIAQIVLARRQPCVVLIVQSDEKSDCAIRAQSLCGIALNLILVGISESMVTAYGLYYKIQQFLLFAAFGMRDAIMPITAFSYGMGDKKRITDCVKFGQLYTAVIMLAGMIVIEVFAEPFAGLFGLSGETQRLCVSAMHIISIGFVFSGVNIAFQGVFQALGGGIESLIVSVCRQLAFVFPLAWIFSAMIRADGSMTTIMWAVFPIAEILTAAVALVLYRRIYKRKV